ncbi:unnamed protein product [Blepharisma stoltei]|uniref:PIPK domain-containing protein n=1 Tax=Blepharisma stoltei TaxID=1481888 RepID=A0AAU9KBF8_9CILI|nr:unnamed protein product [Blepharisma stoltei]
MASLDQIVTLGVVLASVSFVFSIATAMVHFLIPKMMDHPGQLVFIQCLTQAMYDLHWFSGEERIHTFLVDNNLCEVIGGFNVFFFLLAWNYLVALSLEIIIKLTFNGDTAYLTRLRIYHALSSFIAFFLVLIVIIVGSFGTSHLRTCFINPQTSGHYIEFVPLVVHLPIMWSSVVIAVRKIENAYAKVMFNYTMVILCISSIWTISTLASVLDVFNEQEENVVVPIGVILGCLSGIVVAVARLSNKELLLEIYVTLFKRKGIIQREYNISMQQDLLTKSNISLGPDLLPSRFSKNISYLGDFFHDLTEKTVLEILCTLSLRFENLNDWTDLYEITFESFKMHRLFSFQLNDFKRISLYHGIDLNKLYYPELKLKEWAPDIFASLRQKTGVSVQELYRSLINKENLDSINVRQSNQGGKSQAFIYTTSDEKFIIKTMTATERKFFLKDFLGIYYNHIITNPDSLIVRILGIFTLLPFNVNLILMENIIPNKSKAYIFDLKGSTVGRTSCFGAEMSLLGVVQKDNNFREFSQRVRLNENLKTSLIKAINSDSEMLRSVDIMDYSLILAFYQESWAPNIKCRYLQFSPTGLCYSLGIIDIFQEYTFKKATEKAIKTVLKGKNKDLSVANPAEYGERFCKFFPYIFQEDQ